MLNYQDMFDYFKKEREGLIHAFENIPEEEFTRNRGLSFDSIKDVFVRTLIVEDNWLHYRAAGLGEATHLKVEDFRSLQDIKRYISEVDERAPSQFLLRVMTRREPHIHSRLRRLWLQRN